MYHLMNKRKREKKVEKPNHCRICSLYQTHMQKWTCETFYCQSCTSSNCSGSLTLHWLFPKLSKVVVVLESIAMDKKVSTKPSYNHMSTSVSIPWNPWQIQAQLDDAMKMWCTVWVIRRAQKKNRKNLTKRRKDERMTYNITESLCVALKLYSPKRQHTNIGCVAPSPRILLAQNSLSLTLSCVSCSACCLYLPIIYIPSIKWNTNKYIIKSSHTLFHGAHV